SLAAVKCRGAADGAVLDLHMPCRPQDDRAFAERVYGQVEQVNPLRQRPTVAPDLHGEAGGLRTVAIQRQVAYGDVAAPARHGQGLLAGGIEACTNDGSFPGFPPYRDA